jgi:hypothetical protein
MRIYVIAISAWVIGICCTTVARADGPPDGSSPFIIALYKGNTAAVVEYLSAGGDPNAESPEGAHPMNLACDYGDAELAQALLEAGSRVEGNRDDPPLGWCAYNGNGAVLRVLIEAGADVNAKGSDGESALDSARRGRQRQNEKILRTHGATVMKQQKTALGTSKQASTQVPKKSEVKAVRVKVMDGHCQSGTSGCSNPLLAKVHTLISEAGYTITAREGAKNHRDEMEVWFTAGNKKAAQDLVTRHLAPWVKVSAIREWTWGGDFDLLVIVARK